jgi:hypothetical protein
MKRTELHRTTTSLLAAAAMLAAKANTTVIKRVGPPAHDTATPRPDKGHYYSSDNRGTRRIYSLNA